LRRSSQLDRRNAAVIRMATSPKQNCALPADTPSRRFERSPIAWKS